MRAETGSQPPRVRTGGATRGALGQALDGAGDVRDPVQV